ncbi:MULTISPECIES: hypothetical protein [unclassified Acetobacter]|uniref:hypothetical protein n=1 Tax=unclassified Acetobacter TaxID=2628570 RepID=UPI001239D367|nr:MULTISPECIES: hypothetical protein [unclassified Acetobacter]KAA8392892.1 hypothetical protein FKW19_14505 [Acetobacter sp. DmW_125128]
MREPGRKHITTSVNPLGPIEEYISDEGTETPDSKENGFPGYDIVTVLDSYLSIDNVTFLDESYVVEPWVEEATVSTLKNTFDVSFCEELMLILKLLLLPVRMSDKSKYTRDDLVAS